MRYRTTSATGVSPATTCLGNDARLRLSREEIQQIYDANAGDTGMAAAQVDGFCAMVDELAARFPDGVEYAPGAIL